MSQPSFTHVPAAGFSAFELQLASPPWSLVNDPNPQAPNGSFWQAPPLVLIKARLKNTVQTLLQTIAGASGAKLCDRRWDTCQKQLRGQITLGALSDDPAKRDAAERLHNVLLLGAGEGQTQLRYQEEVDFGRKQIALMSSPTYAADMAALGLGSLVPAIAATTDALALAIGHGTTNRVPSRQKAHVVSSCVATFGWAAEALTWLIANAGPGPEKELAEALFASLDDLSRRYSARISSSPADVASPPSG